MPGKKESMEEAGEGGEKVCIEIPADIYEELKRLADELGIPIGTLLRRLLEKA